MNWRNLRGLITPVANPGATPVAAPVGTPADQPVDASDDVPDSPVKDAEEKSKTKQSPKTPSPKKIQFKTPSPTQLPRSAIVSPPTVPKMGSLSPLAKMGSPTNPEDMLLKFAKFQQWLENQELTN